MRPLESTGSGGATTAGLVAVHFAALTGLAALDSVADFAVLREEGKNQFYQSEPACRPSLHKHAVPVRVKPISLADRVFISSQDALAPGEGRHQHQQR